MATQEQWYQKLRSWVPVWFFNEEYYNDAVFYGLARVLSELDARSREHQAETFILQADGAYVDEHGLERNLERGTFELDALYAERIRYIKNSTSKPEIKRLVDALLSVGESIIIEDWESGLFCDRESFYSRGSVFIDGIYNVFSIIVDKQVHAPYSFYSREYFCDREDYTGTNESSLALFELIVDAVDRAKALGTLYRVIERVE